MIDARFVRLRRVVGDSSYHVLVGGDGPPVLLLHGFPETHVCWDRVAPVLAERHTVVLTDLRSTPTTGPGGHFVPEEAPIELLDLLHPFLG